MYWMNDDGPRGYVEMLSMEKRWSRTLDTLFAWHPFYASLLIDNMERVETETLPNGAPCPVMATDGYHLYWNPVTVPRLRQEDMIFVVVHELEHVRLGHHLPMRCAALRDNDLRQKSADDAINSLLIDELGLKCSKEMYDFLCMPQKDGLPSGLCMEDYYERLREKEQERENDEDGESVQNSESDPDDSGDGNGTGSDSSDDGDGTSDPDGGDDPSVPEGDDADRMDSEGTPGEGEGDGDGMGSDGADDGDPGDADAESGSDSAGSDGGQRMVDTAGSETDDGETEGSGAANSEPMTPEHLGEVLPAPTNEDQTNADVENKWQTSITRAAISAHEAGNLPGHIREFVDQSLEVKPIPWQTLLKKAIRAMFPAGRTFARPSRRSGWRRDVIMPDMNRDGLDDVQFYTDTSGSMRPADMAMTLPHIARILSLYRKAKLRVVQFDTRITRDDTYGRREWKSIKPNEHEWLGRGGTYFAAAIDEINKTKPKLAIILTDGYPCDGWFESRVPIIWLMTTDVVAPYGKTVHIRPEERNG